LSARARRAILSGEIMRFTPKHVEQWRVEGLTILERFFPEDEYLPVLNDFETLYASAGQGVGTARHMGARDDASANRALQFKNIHIFPYEGSSAINLISLHPELIAFAKALLGTSEVRLYQSHTWAKFTGEADYDQQFHCDFGNHTLTVPADDASGRTVDFILYLTDVTRELGALRYVTHSDVVAALGSPVISPTAEQQPALHAKERIAEVPAGSLIAHGIDTMHRGANLTAAHGRRFSMTVGYKAAGNDQVAFHAWQDRGNRHLWAQVFSRATPEQLACLGIPRPGDPFWTTRTLELTQARWPEWDMREYVEARARAAPLARRR
jgi:ectoine hydroxylase-related dioxygenase (phytanoyl-CoA dioxygenase family)